MESRPLYCAVSICKVVSAWPRFSVDPREVSRRTSEMVVFQKNMPSAINAARMVAVIDFVFEPRWNGSVGKAEGSAPYLRFPATMIELLPSSY